RTLGFGVVTVLLVSESLNELEKIKRMNDVSLKAMQNQIDMVKKGELKAITTRSGLVIEGPTVPNPPKPVNPEEDECVEEQYTDPDHAEYNIKVPPPPLVQKPMPPFKETLLFIQGTLFHRVSRIPPEC
nr:hypothetical protein [Tanacetum cinerariifolium]